MCSNRPLSLRRGLQTIWGSWNGWRQAAMTSACGITHRRCGMYQGQGRGRGQRERCRITLSDSMARSKDHRVLLLAIWRDVWRRCDAAQYAPVRPPVRPSACPSARSLRNPPGIVRSTQCAVIIFSICDGAIVLIDGFNKHGALRIVRNKSPRVRRWMQRTIYTSERAQAPRAPQLFKARARSHRQLLASKYYRC